MLTPIASALRFILGGTHESGQCVWYESMVLILRRASLYKEDLKVLVHTFYLDLDRDLCPC